MFDLDLEMSKLKPVCSSHSVCHSHTVQLASKNYETVSAVRHVRVF